MIRTGKPAVLALIPARQGSKSIPHKNIRSIGGKPLLAYSIEHAQESQCISRTIVSTDSQDYADIARKYGAEVPFIRPDELAQDHSTDFDVFLHALEWLQSHEGYSPDICVHLRPTCPVRKVTDIDAMVEILLQNPALDSVRAIVENIETPYKMWFRSPDGLLKPIIQTDIPEAYNQPRQILPVTYLQNASIDVIRTSTIVRKRSMTGNAIYGYVMNEMFDIDYESQLDKAIHYMHSLETSQSTKKVFCFDIDGVIACLTPDNDYARASCLEPAVALITALHEQGHYIILATARGTKTGLDWKAVTEEQMKKWGVKYHELHFGKPAADYYVDDRMISLDNLKKLLDRN
jgi:CMP-N,N'-diacetyllegionaminic acid synthase